MKRCKHILEDMVRDKSCHVNLKIPEHNDGISFSCLLLYHFLHQVFKSMQLNACKFNFGVCVYVHVSMFVIVSFIYYLHQLILALKSVSLYSLILK